MSKNRAGTEQSTHKKYVEGGKDGKKGKLKREVIMGGSLNEKEEGRHTNREAFIMGGGL